MLETKKVGSKIAEARRKINFSQAELAQRLFISPQAVGKWERGESMPDIITFNRMAKIFGVDLNYFSDNFQVASFDTSSAESSKVEPDELSNSETRKRFDWNWDMSNGNWVDGDFSGLKDLKDRFNSSNIKNCKFVKSDLSGLTLKGNEIKDCDFSQSDISNAKIHASEILKSAFDNADLIDSEIYQSEIHNCNFDNANFSRAEFVNSNFQKTSMENAVFRHTTFKKPDFQK